VSKPKFSWEPSAGGSLLLRVTDGSRETTWRLKKTVAIEDVQRMFEEIVGVIDYKHPTGEPWGLDYKPPVPKDSIWLTDTPSVPLSELAESEEDSKASLQLKADSVKLDGGDWWGGNDMDDLNLYTFGTGDPE